MNQSIGELNYRYFLRFLVMHGIMLVYADYLLFSMIASEVVSLKLFEQTFVNAATGEKVKASYTVVFQFIMHRQMPIVTLFLLCFVMTFVLWGFFGYHLWLIARGLTTNESFKWSGVSQYFKRLRTEHAAARKAIDGAILCGW